MAIHGGGDEILATASLAGRSSGTKAQDKESSSVLTVVQAEDKKIENGQQSFSLPFHQPVAFTPADNSDLGRIFSLSPLPTIVLDANLCVVQVSDSHLSFSGYSRKEMIGHSIYDFPAHKIPAPDISGFRRTITDVLETGDVQIINDVIIDDDINYKVFNVHIVPIQEDGKLRFITITAYDITKKSLSRQSRQEMAYLNETYNILINTVKDYAIFVLDTAGYVVTWNSGAAILKGYTSEEIIGRHFSVFFAEEDRAVDKPGKELELCLREGKVEDEGWRYRKDGSRFWANVIITAVYNAGRHVGFAKVTRDLTKRKAAERRLITAFEESSKLKLDFLANMSHEIRTPMHGMLMSTQMLAGTNLDEKQKEYINIIEDTGSVLLQIINDVLDYSKLSSSTFSITTGDVDIIEVVSAVSRNCRSSLKADVDLNVHYSDYLPKILKGDSLRYRQIVQNLVGNAVKFTDRGSIQVMVEFAEDPTDETSCEITTKVVDTGIGVPEDSVSTLFTPFTEFADTSHKRYHGTGLGLSICKSLAELMDGAIGYQPNLETHGSIFWLTVKMGMVNIGKSEAEDINETKGPDLNEQIQELAPRKQLLLVEDNTLNQTIMLKMLNMIGFEKVDTAWNGTEAIQKVKQKPLSYNAILMDINMPDMNGMDATVAIRKLNTDVPIIAMTGNALKGDAEACLANGMNDYIAKPVHKQHLISVLLKWIGS